MPEPGTYRLHVLKQELAVCRLEAPPPETPPSARFWSLTRTENETSLICSVELAPGDCPCERGWIAFEVEGPFEFNVVGVMARLSGCLAEARLSVLAVATFDTDYLLVRKRELENAVAALEEDGHIVERPG